MKTTARFLEALELAAELHANQTRKGSGTPYMGHLLAVTSIVIENGGNEDEAIAALLHDAVEDQGGLPTLERIRAQFGDTVAEIVMGCTDSTETDPGKKLPWRERKQRYLALLVTAPASVRLVSAADKTYNLCSLLDDFCRDGDSIWNRFKGGKDGTLWYYGEAIKIFKAGGPQPLAEKLERTMAQLNGMLGTLKLATPQDPLTAQQKEAMRLREEEHLTYREIAARMGVTHHRIRQVITAARARLSDCAVHGEEAPCLLPKRVRGFLEWHDLTSPAALRAVIKSKRLTWNVSWKRLTLDGNSTRNVGWQSWQVMCEWAGLPRPKSPKKSGMK